MPDDPRSPPSPPPGASAQDAAATSAAGTASVWLATGLGFGFSPVAPGTIGTLWGLPLAWTLAQLPGIGWQIVAIVVLFLVGIPICTLAAQRLGGAKDPGSIVLDEIVSLPIVFLGLAVERPAVAVAGFVLHRIFDIAKPPPVRQAESLPRGLGIMADDIVAAVYACAVLHLLAWWNPAGWFAA